MQHHTTLATKTIGYIAGTGTTLSFVPQVLKVVRTGSTEGMSSIMFVIHLTGVTLWIVYGVLMGDPIVIVYNCISDCLCLVILAYFLRDAMRGQCVPEEPPQDDAELMFGDAAL